MMMIAIIMVKTSCCFSNAHTRKRERGEKKCFFSFLHIKNKRAHKNVFFLFFFINRFCL